MFNMHNPRDKILQILWIKVYREKCINFKISAILKLTNGLIILNISIHCQKC